MQRPHDFTSAPAPHYYHLCRDLEATLSELPVLTAALELLLPSHCCCTLPAVPARAPAGLPTQFKRCFNRPEPELRR